MGKYSFDLNQTFKELENNKNNDNNTSWIKYQGGRYNPKQL